MSTADGLHWDTVYSERGRPAAEAAELPAVFRAFDREFPTDGRALELACGQGGATVWLARRGLQAWGVDASPVAIAQAAHLAAQSGVADRCRFDVADLDQGLPPGPAVDVLLCHRFWAPDLAGAIVQRLATGGVLAIAVLSEVGAAPGRYRAAAGELNAAFSDLAVIAAGEGGGQAWLLGRKN